MAISAEKRAYNREYYSRNKKRLIAASSAWYAEHREEQLARKKEKRDSNLEEARSKSKEYYLANADRIRGRERHKSKERRRYTKYGITRFEYDAILAQQGGVCAICAKACDVNDSLSIDHDHKTNRVRGLLCKRCNSGLGFFREDIAALARAAAYLKESK